MINVTINIVYSEKESSDLGGVTLDMIKEGMIEALDLQTGVDCGTLSSYTVEVRDDKDD